MIPAAYVLFLGECLGVSNSGSSRFQEQEHTVTSGRFLKRPHAVALGAGLFSANSVCGLVILQEQLWECPYCPSPRYQSATPDGYQRLVECSLHTSKYTHT